MNYAERVARGSFVLFSMTVLASIFGYLLRIFVARNLTIAEFGLFYAVLSFIAFFSLFKDLGLGAALTKMIPEFIVKKNFSQLKSVIRFSLALQVVVGLMIAVFLIVSSTYLSVNFFHAPSAEVIIKIMALEFFVGFSALRSILQGFQKIKAMSFIEPVRVILVFVIFANLVNLGLLGLSLGYLITTAVLNAIIFIYVASIYRSYPYAEFDIHAAKDMTKFGLTTLVGGVAGLLVVYTDTLIITFFRSLEEVGLYQAAMPTSQLAWIFAGSLATVLLPVVSEIWSKGEKNTLGLGLSLLLKVAFITVVPVVVVMFAFPDVVLNLIFGTGFVGASTALQILAVAAIFYTTYTIMFVSIIGIGKPLVTTKIAILIAFFNLVLNLLVVPRFGINGAATTTLMSYLLATILSYSYLRRTINLKVEHYSFVMIFISGLLATAVIFVAKSMLSAAPLIEALFSVLAGFLVYFSAIVTSKAIKKSDIKMLLKINIPVPKMLIKIADRIFTD